VKTLIAEFARAVLTEAISDAGVEHRHFQAGDVGIVVDVLGGGAGYILEMMTADGSTLDVITVHAHQVREVTARDMLHVRDLESVGQRG
jgi:capsid protein